ncbi:MAG TPA: HipA domain-containing protein [Gammaproteobacteria bacterium]
MAKKKGAGNEPVYAWIFLPGETVPVVCGALFDRGDFHDFGYGRSYLENPDRIPLDHGEMPLERGLHRSRHEIQGAIRDAAPDAWGRRVLIRRLGMSFERGDQELRETDYLLGAKGERIGALHFQADPNEYRAPELAEAPLADLLRAAELLEKNEPLPPELEAAIMHGTSIGGARPKALIDDGGTRRLVAKFASTTDLWPVVRHEALGMNLASAAGLDVAATELVSVDGKDVLLVERFDRVREANGHFSRRHFFSALTALGLSEMQGRYASYPEFADFLVKYSERPAADCRELYRRMVLNMMIGNTDDHARNHAVFWNGKRCRLTPAYDVCVMRRAGQAGSQAMAVGENGNRSSLANALTACGRFGLGGDTARRIHAELGDLVQDQWRQMAREAGIGPEAMDQLEGTAILSPGLFE